MERDLRDMTLACEDKQIKTHKLVISSCSPILRNILKINQNPYPIVYLRKVKYRNLQNLINFMYQGEVNIAEEDLPSFLELAEDLNVKGLSEGNADVCDSSEKGSSQFNHSNIGSYPKVNGRRMDDRKQPNGNGHQMNGSITEYLHEDETFINNDNDNDSDSLIAPTGNQRILKEEAHEDIEQSIESLSARKQAICIKCDKQFLSYTTLKLHTKSVHEGSQYSCHKCTYSATQSGHLKRHIKSIHERERHPCDQCDYKATVKSDLPKHRLRKHK